MNRPYLSFLLLLGFVAFNAALLIGLSHLLAPHKPNAIKDSPYESGMPPLGNARDRFSVKFYLVAMLFIVFDIETGFLLVEMLVFMFILAVGYVYVWKRGALEWD